MGRGEGTFDRGGCLLIFWLLLEAFSQGDVVNCFELILFIDFFWNTSRKFEENQTN